MTHCGVASQPVRTSYKTHLRSVSEFAFRYSAWNANRLPYALLASIPQRVPLLRYCSSWLGYTGKCAAVRVV